MKTLIVIPSRMASSRFPNKPMAIINGKPMIQRVWEKAVESNVGEVIVACCDEEVSSCIDSLGGKAIMTDPDLPTGTDRIYQAIKNKENITQFDSIINLQGDMPIIDPKDIKKVNIPLSQGFDIGTLVTDLKENQVNDINITKAEVNWIKKNLIGQALNFCRTNQNKDIDYYHHVGIYSFRYEILKRFISISPTKNEINQKLEQLRALDSKITIGVNYVNDVPISVDTKEDLIKIEKILKVGNDKN